MLVITIHHADEAELISLCAPSYKMATEMGSFLSPLAASCLLFILSVRLLFATLKVFLWGCENAAPYFSIPSKD
jgi:hypothetical protein